MRALLGIGSPIAAWRRRPTAGAGIKKDHQNANAPNVPREQSQVSTASAEYTYTFLTLKQFRRRFGAGPQQMGFDTSVEIDAQGRRIKGVWYRQRKPEL